ncbi:MAG: hypothetical protein DRG50_06055, partial [Deltaproteobacteria bacterium]
MKKKIKIAAIILMALFLLVVVVAVILPHLISLDRYKDMIEARLEEALKREVSVGALRITILPTLGAKIEDLIISNPPGFSPTPFLFLHALRVRVKILPLLRGKKEIAGLTLQGPEVFVERDKRGRWNIPLIDIRTKSHKGELKSAKVKVRKSKLLQGLSLSKASIKGGKFIYLDRNIDRRIEIEQMDLELKDISFEKKIRYNLSLEGLQGDLWVQGWVGPLGEKTIDMKNIPLWGRVKANFPKIDDLAKALIGSKGPALQAAVKIDLNLQADTGSPLKLQGKILVKSLSIEKDGKEFIKDLNLFLKPQAALSPGKGELRLKSILQIEETPFQIKGKFTDLWRKPSGMVTFSSTNGIDLKKWGSKFPPLEKVLNIKGTLALRGDLRIPPSDTPLLFLQVNSPHMGITLVKRKKIKETQFVPQAKEAKRTKGGKGHSRLDIKGELEVTKGRFQGIDFRDLYLKADMERGKLKIERFSLAAFGGELEGSGGIDG